MAGEQNERDGHMYDFGKGPRVVLDGEEGFILLDYIGTDNKMHVIVASQDPFNPRTMICRPAMGDECQWLPDEEEVRDAVDKQ